jgi:hypothetical protein
MMQVQMAGGLAPANVSTAEQLPARVRVVIPAAQQPFTFDALGRPVDAAGMLTPHVIQLRHAETGLVRTVTVGTTGRITIN